MSGVFGEGAELTASAVRVSSSSVLDASTAGSVSVRGSEGVVVSPGVKSRDQADSVAALSTKPSSLLTPKKDAATSPRESPQPPPSRLQTAQPEELVEGGQTLRKTICAGGVGTCEIRWS